MKMGIGERIRIIREARQLSQEGFAHSIGLESGQSVSRMERGVVAPTEKNIKMICSMHGVRREFLEEGTGEIFEDTEVKRNLLERYEGLSENNKEVLAEIAEVLLKNQKLQVEPESRE